MHASAFIIGGDGNAVAALAGGVGLSAVLPFTDIEAVERQLARTPMAFFLFAEVTDVRQLARDAMSIRFHEDARIRFAPLLYLAMTPSVDAIRLCVAMGFDDIIALPIERKALRERLELQIGKVQVFFETADYFGPDRRGRYDMVPSAEERRFGGQYRRFEVVRTTLSGPTVLKESRFP